MLSFYFRIATEPHVRKILHLTITFITLTSATTILINLFGCIPVSGAWNRRPTDVSVCITTSGFYYYTSAINIATDLLLLVLPIPILAGLRVQRAAKLGLVVMFSMGFLFVHSLLLHSGM